jgi:hypothetical protein
MRQAQVSARQPISEGRRRAPLALCGPEILSSRAYISEWGILFSGDCLQILPHIHDSTVDTVFADPPFNLAKNYGRKVKGVVPEYEITTVFAGTVPFLIPTFVLLYSR